MTGKTLTLLLIGVFLSVFVFSILAWGEGWGIRLEQDDMAIEYWEFHDNDMGCREHFSFELCPNSRNCYDSYRRGFWRGWDLREWEEDYERY